MITKLAIGLLIIGIAIAGGCVLYLSAPEDLVGKTDALNVAWKVFCNHTNVTLFTTIKPLDGTYHYIVKNDTLEKKQEFGDWEITTSTTTEVYYYNVSIVAIFTGPHIMIAGYVPPYYQGEYHVDRHNLNVTTVSEDFWRGGIR